RERFAGGLTKSSERRYGSLKAIDPTTGETKLATKLDYPPYAGILATAGNLVFTGHIDGTFAAYDAKTREERRSYNVGAGITAPAVIYSVNGKQYIAVLVGAKPSAAVIREAQQLKDMRLT